MMTFQNFMDSVDLTNHQLAKVIGTSRAQLWRWKDYTLMDDGSLVHPKMLAKIRLQDFNLDELDDLKSPD